MAVVAFAPRLTRDGGQGPHARKPFCARNTPAPGAAGRAGPPGGHMERAGPAGRPQRGPTSPNQKRPLLELLRLRAPSSVNCVCLESYVSNKTTVGSGSVARVRRVLGAALRVRAVLTCLAWARIVCTSGAPGGGSWVPRLGMSPAVLGGGPGSAASTRGECLDRTAGWGAQPGGEGGCLPTPPRP